MSKIITGADHCEIADKARVFFCKTHNYTFSAGPRPKQCPVGRKGQKAQMWVWTPEEEKVALK